MRGKREGGGGGGETNYEGLEAEFLSLGISWRAAKPRPDFLEDRI